MTADDALTAFVSFPSPYTQSLLQRALATVLPAVHITHESPDEQNPPRLQWADYDLMAFDKPHADQSYLISSYVYRKALIRKHQLHLTVQEYLAKASHRGIESVLAPKEGGVGGIPRGWVIDIQFADELDELLMDDLYELGEMMRRNEEEGADKQWYILKPGFADKAQGIRLFSTEEELRAIYEEFEPESEDEDDEAEDEETEDETGATGVLTSQLRHFVIQEYLPRPVLVDLNEGPSSSSLTGQKFHLRAYVLLSGSYSVYLSRTMLALFSGAPYSAPQSSADLDLRPHLTNTCLQTDSFGVPVQEEDLVRLFWDLEGQTALASTSEGYEPRGKITRDWLDTTFVKAGAVVAETVKAGVDCGSFGLQLLPNAFEIFGVDLMVSFPEAGDMSEPDVTLLEFNASPDFMQSGEALRPKLLDMFKGVVRLSVAPFFGVDLEDEGTSLEVGEERYDWRLVAKGEVRGDWA